MNNDYLKEIVQAMGPETSLTRLQEYVNLMVQVRGFDKESPQDCLLLLTEELGELAKEVRKSCTAIKSDVDKTDRNDLKGEMRDVLMINSAKDSINQWENGCLRNVQAVNLTEAAQNEMVSTEVDLSSVATQTSSGFWSVQAGAFGSEENARNYANTLQSQIGQIVTVRQDGNLYRVLIGEFSSKDEASDQALKMGNLLGKKLVPIQNP